MVAASSAPARGPRMVAAWQFGLRRPGAGWRSAALMIGLLLVGLHRADAVWSEVVHPTREKLLENLGTNEGTTLLYLERGADVHRGADVRGVPLPRLHVHGAAQLARNAGRRR